MGSQSQAYKRLFITAAANNSQEVQIGRRNDAICFLAQC